MKITILTENVAGRNCLAEFGLSYFIEADKKVLFDTGSSNVFVINAERLGVSLEQTDVVILSHGHWDHGNGLKYFEGKTLLTHPGSFVKRYNQKDNRYLGLELLEEQVKLKYNLITSREPFAISPEIIFLGEIPRMFEFEANETYYYLEDGSPDFIPDDSALAIKTSKGIVVVTGCAHSGVCNIIEYACKVCNTDKVYAVIGGFHLKGNNEITLKTIQYLKGKGIERVYPSHCTSLPALVAFSGHFKIFQVLTGDYFYF